MRSSHDRRPRSDAATLWGAEDRAPLGRPRGPFNGLEHVLDRFPRQDKGTINTISRDGDGSVAGPAAPSRPNLREGVTGGMAGLGGILGGLLGPGPLPDAPAAASGNVPSASIEDIMSATAGMTQMMVASARMPMW